MRAEHSLSEHLIEVDPRALSLVPTITASEQYLAPPPRVRCWLQRLLELLLELLLVLLLTRMLLVLLCARATAAVVAAAVAVAAVAVAALAAAASPQPRMLCHS